MPSGHLPEVREQYEALPYPPRNPDDERKRLARTWLDDLPMINHYCFAGRQTFESGFRVLVAGGGTGDGTIFLAEQLRNTDAEVVHLDFSRASTQVAQRRAEVRGLTNIRWVEDSLLNLPQLDLGRFDYINCAGVLHHLADPDLGVRALLGVLKDAGALGLMVYGTYGRTGVYQMQSLMRLVNDGESDARRQIANTKEMLGALPQSNWFKRGEEIIGDHRIGDAGLYDLLLHSQDRAYSVGELFDWLATGHSLNLELTDVQCGRSSYLPHLLMGPKPPKLLGKIRALPLARQYQIAELLTGRLQTHSFYATRSAQCKAPYGDPDYVPFFFHEPITGPQVAAVFAQSKGQPFVLNHTHSGVSMTISPGKYGPAILRNIDGRASFHEIFERVRMAQSPAGLAPPGDAILFEDFREIYDTFNALERLLLKHV